eukprot:815080-Prymnesium_polylepis.1
MAERGARARALRGVACVGGWGGVAAASNTAFATHLLTCDRACPCDRPDGSLRAGRQDMYEDAEDSGDEEQRVKTRKTASGRVLIHSKEGTTFKHLKSTYA